jgi:hypothetical protein
MAHPILPQSVVRSICVALAALAVASGPVRAQDASATKAAMVYNFIRFTAWPDSRFSSPSDRVVLCVDPDTPLAASLQGIAGQPVGARTLEVRLTSRIDRSCHAAFIGAQNASDGYVSSLRDKGVLTVGEAPGFIRSGAIQLVTIGRQVRFEVSQRNALTAGAHLSSNLLRLAVAVQ